MKTASSSLDVEDALRRLVSRAVLIIARVGRGARCISIRGGGAAFVTIVGRDGSVAAGSAGRARRVRAGHGGCSAVVVVVHDVGGHHLRGMGSLLVSHVGQMPWRIVGILRRGADHGHLLNGEASKVHLWLYVSALIKVTGNEDLRLGVVRT